MRIFLAMLAFAVLAGTAVAQERTDISGHKERGSQQNAQQQQADQQRKKKAIDDAFNSAIKQIPDPKEKYDPWKTAR
jgi:hypothetical protein